MMPLHRQHAPERVLTPREEIALDIAETPLRCEACGHVGDRVRWYEVPGAIRFRFCGRCRIRHGAMPIEQVQGG